MGKKLAEATSILFSLLNRSKSNPSMYAPKTKSKQQNTKQNKPTGAS